MNATKFVLCASVLAALAIPRLDEAAPLPQPQEETVTIAIGKDGMKFEEFMELVQRLLKRPLAWDDRRLNGNNKRIHVAGPAEIPVSRVESYLHEVMAAHNLALLPMSDRPNCLAVVEDVQTSQYLKQRAISLDYKDIETAGERCASIFVTVVPIEHLPVEEVQRGLNNIIQEHRANFAHPLPSANAIVICGNGSTIVVMNKIIKKLEETAQREGAGRFRPANPPKDR